MRIGVDVGGTFSDFVLLHEDEPRLQILKVPSTPADPSLAVLEGLKRLVESGIRPPEVRFFAHGTTVSRMVSSERGYDLPEFAIVAFGRRRDPERVRQDVRNGYVSAAAAEHVYGLPPEA